MRARREGIAAVKLQTNLKRCKRTQKSTNVWVCLLSVPAVFAADKQWRRRIAEDEEKGDCTIMRNMAAADEITSRTAILPSVGDLLIILE